MFARSLLATSASFVAVALLGTMARSEDLPPQGQFSITYTAVNPSPAKPVPISATKDIVMNNLIMTASNDSGSGLLHPLAGRCALMVTIDKAAKTLDYKGNCAHTGIEVVT